VSLTCRLFITYLAQRFLIPASAQFTNPDPSANNRHVARHQACPTTSPPSVAVSRTSTIIIP
jgi:hypothetical protein